MEDEGYESYWTRLRADARTECCLHDCLNRHDLNDSSLKPETTVEHRTLRPYLRPRVHSLRDPAVRIFTGEACVSRDADEEKVGPQV